MKRRSYYQQLRLNVSKAKSELKSLETENKRYLEELETRVKDLEKENQKLRQLLENYKTEKFKDIGKDQEEDINQTQKFRQFLKDTFLDEQNNSVKSDQALTWNKFIGYFNTIGK